jgi:clan AA aspartic protease
MISGTVTADREAIVDVTILAADGRRVTLSAVMDTGFTGYLALPSEMMKDLMLPYMATRPATLADGTRVYLSVSEALVDWDGRLRDIQVLEAEGGPLVGMSLLYGSLITIHAVDGGKVTIKTQS